MCVFVGVLRTAVKGFRDNEKHMFPKKTYKYAYKHTCIYTRTYKELHGFTVETKAKIRHAKEDKPQQPTPNILSTMAK